MIRRIVHPHSSLRAVAPAVLLAVVLLVACFALESVGLTAPAAFDGYALLGALVSYFGIATLVASVALSLVQSATDKWPSYIYAPIRSERERDLLLLSILIGFLVSGGGMTMLAFGLSGWAAFVIAGTLAATSVVQLLGYVITRIGLFDPLHLAHDYANRTSGLADQLAPQRDGACRRRHGAPTEPHPARACINQERFWRFLDRLLGLGRWMVASEREQDANEVLNLAVACVERHSARRRSGAAGRVRDAGLWTRPAVMVIGDERQPDPELSLFYGFEPIGRSSTNVLERTSRHLWVERLASRWIGRYVAYLLSHGERSVDWSGWLRLQHAFAAEAANLARADDPDSVADLGSAITGFLRALGPETAKARRSRDTMIDGLAALLVELATAELVEPDTVFEVVRNRIDRAWGEFDRSDLSPGARAADLVARIALDLRVIAAVEDAGHDEAAAFYVGDLHRCTNALHSLVVKPSEWAELRPSDPNTLFGRLETDLPALLGGVSAPSVADAAVRALDWVDSHVEHWGLFESAEGRLRAAIAAHRDQLAARTSQANPEAALRDVLRDQSAALVVDFDGTISLNQPPPTDEPVTAQPGVTEALARLSRRHMVVVLSARPVRQLRKLIGSSADVRLIGNAGAEVQEPNVEDPLVAPGLEASREQLAAFAGEIAAAYPEVTIENHGWILELKAPQADREAFREAVEQLLGRDEAPAFELLVTRIRSLQVVAPGVPGKGRALERLIVEQTLTGVVMCGDDRSDWPAFVVVARLREKGWRGANVLVRDGRPRVTEFPGCIDIELDDAKALTRLLIDLSTET